MNIATYANRDRRTTEVPWSIDDSSSPTAKVFDDESLKFLKPDFRTWLVQQVSTGTLRRYLTLSSTQLLNFFADEASTPAQENTVCFVTVLDGVVESTQAAYFAHRNNGIRPEEYVEKKDSQFYDRAFYAIRNCGGFPAFIASQSVGEHDKRPHEYRLFQDGCAAKFIGNNAAINAMSASLQLQRSLAALNEECCHSWIDRIHARTAIGPTIAVALDYLHHVKRSQTFIHPDVACQLEPTEHQLLQAAGFREMSGTTEDVMRAVDSMQSLLT